MPITFANNAFLKFNGSKNPELLKKRENIGINTNVLLTNKQVFFQISYVFSWVKKLIGWPTHKTC